MKAVVLAGGQEFGQCPLSRQLPRALWPVIDRPIIESVLATLRDAGIGHMAISANGRTHTIAAKLGYNPTPDVTIHYSEDTMPRGAAGCIKDCEEWLGNQTFLQNYGQTVSKLGQYLNGLNTQLSNQDIVEQMLLRQRDSVSGVSLDEEMTDLVRFQRAFEASARLITTIDEMLVTVVNLKR